MIFDLLSADAGYMTGQIERSMKIRRHSDQARICISNAETKIVVLVGRVVVVAIGNPAVGGIVVPATATVHPV